MPSTIRLLGCNVPLEFRLPYFTRTQSESTVNNDEPIALMGVAAFLNRNAPCSDALEMSHYQ
jgi:hypothetical protein